MEHLTDNELKVVENAMTMRHQLMRQLLDTKRDLDKECGYPQDITGQLCKSLYEREGIAQRVVTILPDESWKMDPEVYETEDEAETAFEKAWKDLVKKFNLYNFLKRADRMSGIGTYGVILLGLSDGLMPNMPVPGVTFDVEGNLTGFGKTKLLYLRTFDETQVTVAKFDTEPTSFRFGLPEFYTINFAQVQTDSGHSGATSPEPAPTQTTIHWHRIVHLADNREASDVFGTPRMKPVYNRLYDLRKILAASGEGYWKGAFPGISFEMDPNIAATAALDKDSLRKEMEEYSNGLQRYLALVGVSAKSLAPQVADPGPHFVTHLKAICVSLGIPYRIFMGSEEAQLAGEQDSSAWNERLKDRQQKYITPMVLTPFAMRLIAVGACPPLTKMEEGITVAWNDLHTPSAKDKAEVAKILTDAITTYVGSGGDALMQPKDFLTKILKFSDEEAESILKAVEDFMLETEDQNEEEDDGTEATTVEKGAKGSRFGAVQKTKTPKAKEDPEDTDLKREQAAADIEKTRAEAKAKAKGAKKE